MEVTGITREFIISANSLGLNKKATIKMVVENKANKDFVRMNILTKGAIIETDLGKARIINRPGQEPQINAVLV